jgi:hypothetical protein
LPVASLRLPEETQGGIPQAILTRQEPTPVGREGQQNASLNAKSAGQMRGELSIVTTMSMAAICVAKMSMFENWAYSG